MDINIPIVFVIFILFILFNKNSNSILSVPTYTKVVKSYGGLFGYKYVDETSISNGSGCSN